jgi:hypothetical protein
MPGIEPGQQYYENWVLTIKQHEQKVKKYKESKNIITYI